MRVEKIGDATLYLGDCLEILPMLSGVDAVVTDPPYGIGTWSSTGGHSMSQDECDDVNKWDILPIGIWQGIRDIAPWYVIWGGNYFAKELGSSKNPLIWDKCVRGTHFAEAEIAWTNFTWGTVRVIKLAASGTEVKRTKDGRKDHPTQKPIAIMSWCISQLKEESRLILDPFMGSGTTGVACINLRRQFIGIEIEPKYFDIACNRIETAWRNRPTLFEPPPAPEQLTLESNP